jgi:hypothetical protein
LSTASGASFLGKNQEDQPGAYKEKSRIEGIINHEGHGKHEGHENMMKLVSETFVTFVFWFI